MEATYQRTTMIQGKRSTTDSSKNGLPSVGRRWLTTRSIDLGVVGSTAISLIDNWFSLGFPVEAPLVLLWVSQVPLSVDNSRKDIC